MADEQGAGQGIKSLDSALSVLLHLSALNGPASLSEIARDCGMPPSKVHRYLASFIHADLVRQEGRSGQYDLGPGALQLGLSALARHDFVNAAADGLPDLAARTGVTALLAVWGTEGATIVRWQRGEIPTVTSMGLGTTLPLLNSATGRAFLAWAPDGAISIQREKELRRAARNPGILVDVTPNKTALNTLVAQIRKDGFACVKGEYIPGLVAVAAPVLDWQNEAQAVITLVGTDPAMVKPGSEVVQALHDFCAQKSVKRQTG
jgi:DNA-binding IclR family transcriptional regulator